MVRIPFGIDVPPRPANPLGTHPPTLLFVGSFRHPPNEDAARRLLQAIAPRLWHSRPDVRFVLAGSDPPPWLRQAAGPRVMVTGPVPDMSPLLDMAGLVIVPLRSGGGMRVKVLEALAAGKAVLCSPLAAEGLDIRDGEQIRFASSDDEFVQQATALLQSADRRRAMARAARAWAVTHATWDRTADRFDALYASLDHPGVRAVEAPRRSGTAVLTR